MKIGKHQGKTFAEIYSEDPQYCRWACKTALTESSSSMTTFAAYVQHRWLLAIHDLLKQARPDSLKGQQLAVTGEPEELSRSIIEDLIPLLGGKVLRSKVSGATGIVAGSKLWNGEGVDQSAKMQEAKSAKVPVLSMDDFHALVATSNKEKVDSSDVASTPQGKPKAKPKAKPKGKAKA